MILVLGKHGQVGSALAKLLGDHALTAGSQDINFLEPDFITKLEQFIAGTDISAIINASAYTQVDKAEGEGREAAFRINGAAVGELAVWCKQRGVKLVHYSTDYVFDGSGQQPRREEENTAPVNAYGQSKLMGEQAIQNAAGDYIIFRTSWVYDAHGKNFFNTILRLMHERESLNVVADQVGAPTYAPHLARATLDILPSPLGRGWREAPGEGHTTKESLPMLQHPHPNPLPTGEGIYHLTSSGQTSWHGFAQAIFALATAYDSGLKCQSIQAIPTSAYPLPAKRPLNSRLDCSKALKQLGIALPAWEMGLKECVDETYAGARLPHSGLKNHPA